MHHFVKSFETFEPLNWQTIMSRPPLFLVEFSPCSDPTPILADIAKLISGNFLGWTIDYQAAFGFYLGSVPVILKFRVPPEVFADAPKLVTFARRTLFREALQAASARCAQLEHDVEDSQASVRASSEKIVEGELLVERLERRLSRLIKSGKRRSRPVQKKPTKRVRHA